MMEATEMTFCRFDEYEDAVLSVELAAEKFQRVQTNPTQWKWVIVAMQNAEQGAMVLALAGTDGCGALYPNSQRECRDWLENPTPIEPRIRMADYNTTLCLVGSKGRNCSKDLYRNSSKRTAKTSNDLMSCGDNLLIIIRWAGE
jgi:hypothetical protein